MTKRYMKDALMGVCTIAMIVVVGVMMITTWELGFAGLVIINGPY